MVQIIIRSVVFITVGWFMGAALAIIAGARPEKRKKYMLKALEFYLGMFWLVGGLLIVVFLNLLIDHHERRKAFKQWKISRIFPKEKMFP